MNEPKDNATGTPSACHCYAVLRDWTITNLAGCGRELSRIDKLEQGRQRIAQGSYWRGQSIAYTNLLSAIDELDSLHDADMCMDVHEKCFVNIENKQHCGAIEALREISRMTSETANIYTAARRASDVLRQAEA